MKPRITNQSYFVKRLKDSGYVVDRYFDTYSEMDPRLWTVVIDPCGASVFCTLYMNRYSQGDYHFEFYDGGQYFGNRKIKTESVEVLVEYLNNCGCIKKHDSYNKEGWKGLQDGEEEKV